VVGEEIPSARVGAMFFNNRPSGSF